MKVPGLNASGRALPGVSFLSFVTTPNQHRDAASFVIRIREKKAQFHSLACALSKRGRPRADLARAATISPPW